jgi:hypothetical protein
MLLATTLASAMLFGVAVGDGRAQLFPSDALTQAFEKHLESLAQNGGAFVSSCRGPNKDEKAILIVPVGSDHGTVTLVASRRVYNGAGRRSKMVGSS